MGLWGSVAQAKTFEVTRTDDPAPTSCTKRSCTLREAVLAANQHGGTDTILLKSGKRYELEVAGPAEDFAFTGDLDVTDGATLEATGNKLATIDANSLDRAVEFFAPGGLSRIEIINGDLASGQGVGVLAATAPVHIDRSEIALNGSSQPGVSGGGVYLVGGGSITNTKIRNNTVPANGGGATVAGTRKKPFLVKHVLIAGNQASGPGGLDASHAVISDSKIVRNTADFCGGMDGNNAQLVDSIVKKNQSSGVGGGVCQLSVGPSLDIARSEITGNSAGTSGGGVIVSNGPGSIIDSTIAGNVAGVDGAGVQAQTAQPLEIRGSTISGNDANRDGGGVHAFNATELTVANSTIAGNSSNGLGGGIWADNPSGGNPTSVVLDFATIAFNSAGSGGGIAGQAPAFFSPTGSIVASNIGEGAYPDCSADVDSQGHNLILDTSNCTAFDAPSDVIAPPLLKPLADNGGPTKTVEPKPKSPAVDGGGSTCPSHDQRGESRPRGKRCDIGAVEVGR